MSTDVTIPIEHALQMLDEYPKGYFHVTEENLYQAGLSLKNAHQALLNKVVEMEGEIEWLKREIGENF